jgi:hypothetical protein
MLNRFLKVRKFLVYLHIKYGVEICSNHETSAIYINIVGGVSYCSFHLVHNKEKRKYYKEISKESSKDESRNVD